MVNKKSKNPSASGKNASLFSEDVNGPHAVMVADLHFKRFEPLCNNLPPCLLPIGGVPVIQLSINWLINNGFKTLIIYACCLSHKVKSFINQFCDNNCSKVCIQVRCAGSLLSTGDIMRDLDSSEVLRGVKDFLFCPADLISSASLMPCMKRFQELRSRSAVAVISPIFTKPPPALSENQLSELKCNVLFAPDGDNRLLKIVPGDARALGSIYLSEMIIKDSKSRLLTNLVDLGIVLCSDIVPSLFQDNFDYKTMSDLINDVLSNQEIMPYTIHVDQLPMNSPVLPITSDLTSLIELTPSLLSREFDTFSSTFPPSLFTQLQPIGHQVYIDYSARLHPSVKLFGSCLIGSNCTIGAGSCLIDCVLGANCIVGSSCRLRRVVAMDDVVIHDRVVANYAWLCWQSQLLVNVRLPNYTFLGPPSTTNPTPVTLGPGPIQLPEKCVVVAPSHSNDRILDAPIGGSKAWAVAYDYTRPDASGLDDDDDEQSDDSEDSLGSLSGKLTTDHSLNQANSIWANAADRLRQSLTNLSSGSGQDFLPTHQPTRKPTTPSTPGRRSHLKSGGGDDLINESIDEQQEEDETFLIDELKRTLKRSLDSNKRVLESVDTVVLEVNSLKHAYTLPVDDLRFLLIKSFIELTLDGVKGSRGDAAVDVDKVIISQFLTVFSRIFTYYRKVINSYVSQGDPSALSLLQAIEDSACYSALIMNTSPYILHYLYDNDLVTESDLNQWRHNSPLLMDEDLEEKTHLLREKLADFFKWLDEAEEEDEDEEE